MPEYRLGMAGWPETSRNISKTHLKLWQDGQDATRACLRLDRERRSGRTTAFSEPQEGPWQTHLSPQASL
jgi:hypothetical protein